MTHNNALFSYGQQMIGALHQRIGEIGGVQASDEGDAEFYVRIFGGDHSYASDLVIGEYGYGYDQFVKGIQIGGDWLKVADENGSLRLGFALNSGKSYTRPDSVYGWDRANGQRELIEVSREKTQSYSAAFTVTWADASGLYVDGVFGGGRYESKVHTPYRAADVVKLKSNDIFASFEAGYGWKLSDRVTIEPQAQVTWQKLDTDRVADVDGVVVDAGTPELFVWRVGVRALFGPASDSGDSPLTQYVKLNYYDSTGPEQRVVLSGERFVTGDYGHTAEVGYGVTKRLSNALAFYGDTAWQRDIGHASREGWAVNMGARWTF